MDLPERFWKKYAKSDLLERERILKPIIKNIDRAFLIKNEKIRLFALQIVLQSYFDDIFESVQTVNVVEKPIKKKKIRKIIKKF